MTSSKQQTTFADSAPLLTGSPSLQRELFCKRTKKCKLITAVFVFIILIVIVTTVLLIVLLNKKDNSNAGSAEVKDWTKEFLKIPSTTEAQKNSFHFSSKTHVAGTQQNYEYALDIQQIFLDMNITTTITNYTGIYLSVYNSSSLAQLDANNISDILMQFDLSEKIIPEDVTSNSSLRHQAWLAYAASGNVNGYLVYVNYGDIKDFEELKKLDLFDIQNEELIAIVRYGALFRGVKALNAADFGFKAMILFSDPEDYGYAQGKVFPNGPWLPASGFQRGSGALLNRCFGNMSPKRSLEYCGRPYTELLPRIPVIPISYSNAQLLMSQMNGPSVNGSNATVDWQGRMNFTYKIGSSNASDAVLVNVQVSNGYTPKNISNVIGFIPGTKYKNESILFAAHRDAWVFGASDPISGTTSIIEIARAFSTLVKEGWKPLRNIYFGSWDAEEFSLIGSTEFAEKGIKFVQNELVAYFNQDVAVSGPDWHISSDPLLEYLAKDVMNKVQQPYYPNISVYDKWVQNQVQNGLDLQSGMLGSGSDYTVFVHEFGIASVDGAFTGQGGTYHSVYDSYSVMSDFVDPKYEYARGAAQLMGLMGFEIANNDILPFNTTNLYIRLEGFAASMKELANEYECNFDSNLNDKLSKAVKEFGNAAMEFSDAISKLNTNDEAYEDNVIHYNYCLRTLGTQFLYWKGLPTRKIFKNMIVAPALDNGYAAQVLPYIAYGIKFNCTTEMLDEGFEVTSDAIKNATRYLKNHLL